MNNDIEASFETLMYQASETAKVWLLAAIRNVDDLLGEGYAAKHPVVIQGMLIAAGLDQHACLMKAAGQDIRDAINGKRLDHIADALLGIEEALKDLQP